MNASKALVAQIRERGWCVIPRVISTEAAGSLAEKVEGAIRARPDCFYEKAKIAHYHGAVNDVPELAEHVSHPLLAAVIREFLGPFYRISFTTALLNLAGSRGDLWHADWPFSEANAGHVAFPLGDVMMQVTSIWMLTDFTEHSGTVVLEGSHRHDHGPRKEMIEEVSATYPPVTLYGPAGSVAVFDSRIWHTPHANETGRDRVAMGIRFSPWWLDLSPLCAGSQLRRLLMAATGRDENLIPLIPHHVFEGLPEEAKPLFSHWVESSTDGTLRDEPATDG